MLALCRLSRSTFNSWKKSGLDIANSAGAYGLSDVVALTVLVAIREFIPPKEMIAAWRDLVQSGGAAGIVNAARSLNEGDRFDLIVQPQHASLRLALSEQELTAAVRFPTDPKVVVVIDAADRVRSVVKAFDRLGNDTPRPKEKRPGRPRSADRNIHILRGGKVR
jgi:hypothetical protein